MNLLTSSASLLKLKIPMTCAFLKTNLMNRLIRLHKKVGKNRLRCNSFNILHLKLVRPAKVMPNAKQFSTKLSNL